MVTRWYNDPTFRDHSVAAKFLVKWINNINRDGYISVYDIFFDKELPRCSINIDIHDCWRIESKELSREFGYDKTQRFSIEPHVMPSMFGTPAGLIDVWTVHLGDPIDIRKYNKLYKKLDGNSQN